MNINFEYYKIFYYAAKYKSFTKAAHALGSAQPNITRAMNCLEQQIQCSLFIRTNRGVRLTPEGEKLYRHVEAAMIQFQTAESELSASAGLEHGSFSIGATETALNVYLLQQLKNFHIEHPGIRLKIYNHSTPEAIRSVKNGEIDFAVVSTPVNVSFPLKAVPMQSFQEILIAGNSFSSLCNHEFTLHELNNYPLICLGYETTTWNFYYELFLSHGLTLSPDTEAATTDQILSLVEYELGLAFLPKPMAQEALKQHRIIQLKLQEEIPMRQICLVYDCHHPFSMVAQQFRSFL